MRALLALALFFPVAAMAAPPGGHMLLMPADFLPVHHSADEDLALRSTRPTAAEQRAGHDEPWPPSRRKSAGGGHVARYHLSGASVLGGSVNGSIDGRAAKIQLTWSNE